MNKNHDNRHPQAEVSICNFVRQIMLNLCIYNLEGFSSNTMIFLNCFTSSGKMFVKKEKTQILKRSKQKRPIAYKI